ncbi:vitamin D-binding protein-like isoform X2 [Paroedura picta]|uniref:vitamin D-binding protein-like isoform X2 n=1 Tax=Paroedura picta TaxID=143630 RepID=UPI0040574B14
MKAATLTILLLTLFSSHAMHRGRDYMRDKVCGEFKSLGKDKFRAGAIIASSRKYSNATFEEILNVVSEIVSIAEKCCPEGADPECYEKESLALSNRSCSDPSPFPKHSGIAGCCLAEGLERKLCLAALKHPAREIPVYVEPSFPEACNAFQNDPQGFQDRYLYEYSRDYSSAPLPVVAASAMNYVSMVAGCCQTGGNRFCFLSQKFLRRPLVMLTLMSNKMCAHYELLGKEKTKLGYIIKFAQKSPNANFQDVLALATDASEMVSRSCSDTFNSTFEAELSEHTTKICNTLSTKDERFRDCCKCCDSTNKMRAYFCIYSLQWTSSPPQLPDFQKPSDEDLCNENRTQAKEHYFFEIARRYTHAPEALFTAIYESSENIVSSCCSDSDPTACFALKRPKAREQIFDLLEKGNELCSQYTNLQFTEFKEKLRENYRKMIPNSAEDVVSGLVEQRSSFASTCCLLNAPPVYCGLKKTG